eukprot:scpid13550/ scgid4182/ 
MLLEASRSKALVGREDILKRLHGNFFLPASQGKLRPGESRKTVGYGGHRRRCVPITAVTQVLCGLSGIGKSSIVQEYVHRHLQSSAHRKIAAHHYQPTGESKPRSEPRRHNRRRSASHCYTGGVVQLNLASPQALSSSIQHATVTTSSGSSTSCCDRLGWCGERDMIDWCRRSKNWLLILENVDGASMLMEAGSAVWEHLLPAVADRGHCLVVTQSSILPCWLQPHVACKIDVPPLSAEMALSLFRTVLGQATDSRCTGVITQDQTSVCRSSASTVKSRLGRMAPAVEAEVRRLVSSEGNLSGVPAAIEMAAAYFVQHSFDNADQENPGLEAVSALSHALQSDRSKFDDLKPANKVHHGSGVPATQTAPGQEGHAAMWGLLQAALCHLSSAARQLCLLLAFLSPDHIGLDMFVLGKEALPSELRSVVDDRGEHGLLDLLCELRLYTLVQLCTASYPRLGNVSSPSSRALYRSHATSQTRYSAVSIHRLVQSAIRSHVVGLCNATTDLESGPPHWTPEYQWVVSCTLNMLCLSANRHTRLHNEVYLLPHMLSFYEHVYRYVPGNQRADGMQKATAGDTTPKPRPFPDSHSPVQAVSGGAESKSDRGAEQLQWCFFLEEIYQLSRIKHCLLVPPDGYSIGQEAGLLLARSGLLQGLVSVPVDEEFLLKLAHEQQTEDWRSCIASKLQLITRVLEQCPRQHLRLVLQAALHSVPWLGATGHGPDGDQPWTGVAVERWMNVSGMVNSIQQPAGEGQKGMESAFLALVFAVYTINRQLYEIVVAFAFGASPSPACAEVVVLTAAKMPAHIHSALGMHNSLPTPRRKAFDSPASDQDSALPRSSSKVGFCLVSAIEAVVRQLLLARYSAFFHSPLSSPVVVSVPVVIAAFVCFMLLCCQEDAAGDSRTAMAKRQMSERLRTILQSFEDEVFHYHGARIVGMLYSLAANESPAEVLGRGLRQIDRLD